MPASKKQSQTTQTNEPNANGVPMVLPTGAGLEVLTPEDLIIPRLTLVQPTSQIEGIEAGKFCLNLTGEEFDTLDVVFLKVTKGRIYFPEGSTDQKPVCGSQDRLKPSPRFEQPVAETCESCFYANWNGKEPPVCNETLNLLGVMVDAGLPFWWSVKSTAIAPTKRFLSAIALRSRAGKNLFDAQATITSQLVTQPGKKFFLPRFTLTWIDDASGYRELYEQYASEEIERTFQTEDAASEEQPVYTNGRDEEPTQATG